MVRIVTLLVGPASDDHGLYFRACNHNTRDHSSYAKAILSALFPRKSFMIAMAVIGVFVLYKTLTQNDSVGAALFLTVLVMLLVAGILGGIGWLIAFARSISVRANPALKSYVASMGAG